MIINGIIQEGGIILTLDNKDRSIIVGLDHQKSKGDIEKSLDELEELVKAAGGEVLARVVQKKDSIDVAYFIGHGKADEIKAYAEELDADTVIFNDELSGAQIRNLEKLMERKVLDRTNLILDIFANRAKSKEGKLQVKLAQLKYRLPRLIGYRDYLSREGGGIGTRGPGEQKLELDRRVILKEISKIENELKELKKSRDVKRKKREKANIPIVSLVGYTNAGKSTILNSVIKRNENYAEDKSVFAYDMLFATLDTSMREATLPNGQKFLLSDTVGFVDKLPTHLIEAFKATLEEIQYADLILHVIDASDENIDLQLKVTYKILRDLGVLDKPLYTVFNKMDKLEGELVFDPDLVKESIYISAETDEGIDELLKLIEENLPQRFRSVDLLIPYDRHDLVDYFIKAYKTRDLEHLYNGTKFTLEINEIDYNKYNEFIIG